MLLLKQQEHLCFWKATKSSDFSCSCTRRSSCQIMTQELWQNHAPADLCCWHSSDSNSTGVHSTCTKHRADKFWPWLMVAKTTGCPAVCMSSLIFDIFGIAQPRSKPFKYVKVYELVWTTLSFYMYPLYAEYTLKLTFRQLCSYLCSLGNLSCTRVHFLNIALRQCIVIWKHLKGTY